MSDQWPDNRKVTVTLESRCPECGWATKHQRIVPIGDVRVTLGEVGFHYEDCSRPGVDLRVVRARNPAGDDLLDALLAHNA